MPDVIGKRSLLIQLPVPQLTFGLKTANIPLAAACLKQSVEDLSGCRVDILSQAPATYLGDAALLDLICRTNPDILGFTVYCWNMERSLCLAQAAKSMFGCRVVFGGPEITPDNPLLDGDGIDFHVYGEGEALWRRLFLHPQRWEGMPHSMAADAFFLQAGNPYQKKILETGIENVMLLESQRGCPHRCGYCHYGKSRKTVCVLPAARLLDGIRWAVANAVEEIYVLDPSFDARPDLNVLLYEIARLTGGGRPRLTSEIRADRVDGDLAERLARAGFASFEIGLQSTNPAALKQMSRPTDLERFRGGVRHLQANGMRTTIDLIAGLPGDDLDGFKRTVDFVAGSGIGQDVLVFPLSVLPGTTFRKQSRGLGLVFQDRPPYTILSTPTFGADDMAQAFDYAEEILGASLHPLPDLDLSYRLGEAPVPFMETGLAEKETGRRFVWKIVFRQPEPSPWIEEHGRRLTHPYQIVFLPGAAAPSFVHKALGILTEANPHTPLEIVFLHPERIPNIKEMEDALHLHRPLYLDRDMPVYGSRSFLATMVLPDEERCFGGVMRRQVISWRSKTLPSAKQLETLLDLDGILIETLRALPEIHAWQDALAPRAGDFPHITFGDIRLQRRWRQLTAGDDYWDAAFK